MLSGLAYILRTKDRKLYSVSIALKTIAIQIATVSFYFFKNKKSRCAAFFLNNALFGLNGTQQERILPADSHHLSDHKVVSYQSCSKSKLTMQ